MDSNLHAYHIYRISEYYYSFTTSAGVEYECSFTSFEEYFKSYPAIASKVFALDLYRKNPKQKQSGVDHRIAETVVKIVGDFLNSQINAVVYVCDPTDGKGPVRSRLFKSWFNYYEHPSHQIIQVSANFDAGGITLYTTLLVHKKNKLKIQFIEAYDELTGIDEEK
jgi:hypothetical protein